MKNKQNIAMLCNQEQFEAIKPKLEKIGKIGILSGAFTKYNYLTNNFDLIDEFDFIGNCSYWEKEHSGNVHEQWNEKVFLEACGIESEPKFEITKDQILAIHRCASVMNQIDIESWFPQVFEKEKAKLQEYYTGWYKHKNNEFPNWLMYYDFKKRIGYGIGANPEWVDKYYNINNYIEENCMPATQKEVEQALKNEAVRRGFKKGVWIEWEGYKGQILGDIYWAEGSECIAVQCDIRTTNRYNENFPLMKDGIWASVIPTKTKEEVEKFLNCKIV